MAARSFNKLHRARNLAARFSPTFIPTSDPATGRKTSAASVPPPTTPLTSASSTPPSTQQSSTSSSSDTSTSSVLSSSVASSTTSSTSSSTTTTTTSSTSSSLVLQTPLSTNSVPVVTVQSTFIATGLTLAPSTTTSATPSSTPSSSGSINTSAVVGGIAGSLAGLAVLVFLIMWCIRRKRKREEEEWSAAAFKRQSAILVDDPADSQPSYNPRPPTMIERHNASPALAPQRNYPQNFYGGYGQQPAYGPAEVAHRVSPPPVQPYGCTPSNDPSQLTRQPSSAAYLSRQPTAAGYDIPNDPYAHYVDLNRSSVTPFQAAQYADISRQLGADPNPAVTPRKSMGAAPLPSPFEDGAEPSHNAAPRPPSPTYVTGSSTAGTAATSTAVPAPAPRGREITDAKRPDTVYTVYGEGDAYDGF